jgi:delta-1-pyrroline-5-carboxylate synthetase
LLNILVIPEMMNLYQSLFSQYDVAASQLLVTQMDFTDPARLKNLRYAIERLLDSGILPIMNENDAVSGNTGYTADDVFSDNDSLAALCARSFSAEALLLLTDVEGVYDRPPSDAKAKLLRLYRAETAEVEIGSKSAQGRGGMAAKIEAALSAVRPGSSCNACVVASGANLSCIKGVFGTKPEVESPGTLFCTPGSALERQAMLEVGPANTDTLDDARTKALAARTEARKLQAMPYSVRQDILRAVADSLLHRQDEILTANALDVEVAKKENISSELQNRLRLTEEKLKVLAAGIRQIADRSDALGVVKTKRELADGL